MSFRPRSDGDPRPAAAAVRVSGKRWPGWVGGLFLLLSVTLSAQVPTTLLTVRFRGYRQTSSTDLRPAGALFFVEASFASPPPASASIVLRAPSGATYALVPTPLGTFGYEREFDDFPALERLFPAGDYTLVVTGGTTNSTTRLVVPVEDTPDPVRMVNFTELQAWPNSFPAAEWQPIPRPPALELLDLQLRRRDGTQLFRAFSNELGRFTRLTMNGNVAIPFLEDLEGLLQYFRYSLEPANGGATQVAVGFGFGLFFRVRLVTNAPVIKAHPRAAVARVGQRVELRLEVEPNDTLTFRVRKNGAIATNVVPDPFRSGSSPFATFTVPITGPDDAGTYTVEVSNAAGVVTSNPAPIAVMPQLEITTMAGAFGASGTADGPGASARFNQPAGLVILPGGDLVVADSINHTLRRISPAGVVTTWAGAPGARGNVDGPLATARFDTPGPLAIDAGGAIFVGDRNNHTIRRIGPDGNVTTYAGRAGDMGANDGPAGVARFGFIEGIAIDAAGNLIVSDSENHVIRKIRPDGSVSTIAGTAGRNNSLDGVGLAARFNYPGGLVCDSAGNIYVSEFGAIRRINPAGEVVTIFSERVGQPVAVDTGRGDGGISSSPSRAALAFDSSGALYFSTDISIRRLLPGGVVVTMAGVAGSQVGRDGIGSDAGFYAASGIAIDSAGTLFIADAGLHCVRRGRLIAGSSDPLIALEGAPQPQVVARGAGAAFYASATGPGLSYQWFKNGVGLPAATESTLWLQTTTDADAGDYSVLVGNGAGAVASARMPLTITTNPDVGRLVNLSVRSRAGGDSDTLIVGIVVGGASSGAKNLLFRGVGPSLANFGVSGALSDPRLTLLRGGATIATNDDWGGGAALSGAFAAVGAFPLAATSIDAALVNSLAPGAYTLQVTGAGSGTGAVLAEIYDQTAGAGAGGPRLVNLSTRNFAGSGAGALIAGFVVGGSTSRTLLIRGIGPSLTGLGVTGALANPQLRIYSGSTLLASNANWGGSPNLARAFGAAGAFQLASFSTDAATILTLAPGAYTAQITSTDGKTGVALVEIYELP